MFIDNIFFIKLLLYKSNRALSPAWLTIPYLVIGFAPVLGESETRTDLESESVVRRATGRGIIRNPVNHRI